MIDLDHFKHFNDTKGHSVGDELLVSVSHAMQSRLRDIDVLARLGGDEYAVLLGGGDIVRVAFSLDTCDREAIAWAATTTGISGEIIRDLMLLSVEKRFNAYRAPHRVEWLSDNGSGYAADDTVDFAAALGLLTKFTPVRSPESNGMAE